MRLDLQVAGITLNSRCTWDVWLNRLSKRCRPPSWAIGPNGWLQPVWTASTKPKRSVSSKRVDTRPSVTRVQVSINVSLRCHQLVTSFLTVGPNLIHTPFCDKHFDMITYLAKTPLITGEWPKWTCTASLWKHLLCGSAYIRKYRLQAQSKHLYTHSVSFFSFANPKSL